MSLILTQKEISFRDEKGKFIKGTQNPFMGNLELGIKWKKEHALTDIQKKERGWFYDGKIKIYWRNCNCCGIEYLGQGTEFCSYTCSRLFIEATKRGRGTKSVQELDENYRKRIRMCIPYKNWRKEVYRRDDYTCVLCGETDEQLDVDHYPISFSEILIKNNISKLKDALFVDELWDVSNGRTLCINCHRKTDTYGGKKILETNEKKND